MLHLASSDNGAALRAARGVLDWQIAQKGFDVLTSARDFGPNGRCWPNQTGVGPPGVRPAKQVFAQVLLDPDSGGGGTVGIQ